MKQFANLIRTAIVLCSLGLIAACAGMVGKQDVSISMASLQANLDKRFPVNNRVLEMFDIRLNSPRLTTNPAENRLQAQFEAIISPPFTSKTWRGNLTLSGGLRVDSQKNAIFLHNAKVEDFSVDGADPAYKRQFAKISSLLLDRFLQDIPLYTFTPEQTRVMGINFSVAKISAQQDALVVSFEPTN